MNIKLFQNFKSEIAFLIRHVDFGTAVLLSIILLTTNVTLAKAEITQKSKLKSNVTEVVLPVSSNELVTFWAELKGNSTNVVSFRVEAPQGTKVAFSGAQMRGRGKANIEAVSRQAWYPVFLKERYRDQAKEDSEFTLRRVDRNAVIPVNRVDVARSSAVQSRETASQYNVCSIISDQQLQTILDQLKAMSGREWTKEEFCNLAQNAGEEGNELPNGPGGGGVNNPGGPQFPTDPTDQTFLSNVENASLELTGVFRKDSCNVRASKYLTRVTLDFSQVDTTKFPEGIVVRFRGLENVYKGMKAASIKPVSDGMFAPAPLLLMNSVSYNEEIDVMRWSKGKPRKVADVDVENKVYYRGFVFSRSIASSILTGGTASVDKVSDYQSYGACLKMVRSRQRVNGYPGGE